MIITIDGPAGSGKSTIGRRVAEWLDYLFFDTGIMYRAITLQAIRKGVPCNDEQGLTMLAETSQIEVRLASVADGRAYDVFVDGTEVTWEIRSPAVESKVSIVSAFAEVRRALTEKQRRIGLRGDVVMIGRDIGTAVLPEADLKVYLDASVDERAKRRYEEMIERGEPANIERIRASIIQRDLIDSTRPVAPLRPAEDAVVLHTDGMEVYEVVEKVKELVRAVRKEQRS